MKVLVKAVIGVDKVVQRIVTVLCIVFAAAVPALALVSVASRYIPGITAVWSSELSQAATLILVMMGATVGFYKFEHVRITIIEGWKRGWSARTARYIAVITLGLFGLGMILVGIPLLESVARQTTPILRMPLGIPYSSVVIAGAAFLLHAVAWLLGGRRDDEELDPAAAVAGPVPGAAKTETEESRND